MARAAQWHLSSRLRLLQLRLRLGQRRLRGLELGAQGGDLGVLAGSDVGNGGLQRNEGKRQSRPGEARLSAAQRMGV